MLKAPRLLSAVLAFGLLAGCGRNAPRKSDPAAELADIRAPAAFYSVVFYYTPDPAAPADATARQLADRYLPGIPFSPDAEEPKPPYLTFDEEKAPLIDLPVPDAEYFKYAGRGLTPEDIAGVQKTSRATRLVLASPADEVWSRSRAFSELAHEFAVATRALIWDSATRECFSPAAWHERRLASWPTDVTIPEVSRHTTIHLYRPSEDSPYLRAITLGMEKFALPDVVIERMIGSDNRPAGNLINLVCQSLAEDPRVAIGAPRTLRIADLKNHAAREQFQTGLEKGASQEITLALLQGRRQEGDPENDLIEIGFRHSPGATEDERRESALSQLWGSSDAVSMVKHNAEIEAASKRARARLPELQAAFSAGLPSGERILLKAPFARDDEGDEWMWVEVLEWPKGKQIGGLLQNDPFFISKLKAGARVEVNESDVFDYIHFRADGTTEGNETSKLIEKQAVEVRNK